MKIEKSLIVLTFLCLNSPVMADNLIKNGSFENFQVKKDRGNWKIVKLDDWKGNRAEIWNNSLGQATSNGEYKIELDVNKKRVDKFYQNIDLEIGETYKISIDAYARKRGSSKFYIELDGEKILSVKPTSKWQNYSVEFNATKDTHKIAIRESSEENDGLGAILDNVVLQKISNNENDEKIEVDNNETETTIDDGNNNDTVSDDTNNSSETDTTVDDGNNNDTISDDTNNSSETDTTVDNDDNNATTDSGDEAQNNTIIYTKLNDHLFLNDKNDVAIYVDANLNKGAKLIYDDTTIKQITNTVYSHFKDDYDFIFLVTNNETRPSTVTYSGVFMKVKNDVEGIGAPIYSNTQPYGSDSKLKGVMHFAYRSAILRGPTLHEISHYWANKFRFDFNEEPYYRVGGSGHWSYLGFFGGKGQLGGYDANTLQTQKDTDGSDLVYESDKGTTWQVYSAGTFGWNANGAGRIPYNDLELYLMGMIPKSEVADMMVPMPYGSPLTPETKEYMLNNNLSERGRSYFMAQNLARKSWNEIMSDHNIPDRNPDVSNSQKSFKVLTVLLDTQMPKLNEVNGIALQMEKFTLAGDDGNDFNHNFWEATRGIGTLSSNHLDNSLKTTGEDYAIDDDYQEEVITFHNKEYKTVRSPYTGRIWLDRNIGADHVCQSFTDIGCYGDYFQFARGLDGHQLKNSPTTTQKQTSLSPDNDLFVKADYKVGYDWLEAGIDDTKESRVNMVNKTDGSSICPTGFRLPTYEEFYADTLDNIAWDSFPSDSINGNFLKLPLNGYRNAQDQNAIISEEGTRGAYWTSTTIGEGSDKSIRNILFTKESFLGYATDYLSNGEAIRCIKAE